VENIGKLLVFAGLAWRARASDVVRAAKGVGFAARRYLRREKQRQVLLPIVTCLLVSAVLTLLVWLFRK
jgi:ABC-type dipeptide/oligopeptide/nickel transport system permease component